MGLFGKKKEQTKEIVAKDSQENILREELENSGIDYDFIDVSVSTDPLSVGVLGDNRNYGHIALIEITKNNKPLYNNDFYAGFSTRITNEVKGINRVVYFTI